MNRCKKFEVQPIWYLHAFHSRIDDSLSGQLPEPLISYCTLYNHFNYDSLNTLGKPCYFLEDNVFQVGWRVEHVIAKWEMLGQLRGKGRSSGTGGSDIYSDIEMEVNS